MGDEQQCLGIALALGVTPEIKRISPRFPWNLMMPYGPIDPGESSRLQNSPLAPPFPDCVIASGRRTVPYLRHLKKASHNRIFTVFLKDPRVGSKAADFIWAPLHDRIAGKNVFKTRTPPHRVSQERLFIARETSDPRLSFPSPRVTVLVGGDSRHHRFTPDDIKRFCDNLRKVINSGAHLMITLSRRTPENLKKEIESIAHDFSIFLWDGTGENPYISLLALADWIIVTTDSSNLVGEAVASGAPLLLFEPTGGHPKFDEDIQELKKQGIAYDFNGELLGSRYKPIDSTPIIADRIREFLKRHQEKYDML